jgi:uncharacterized protein YgbK (DUF1537 family)
MASPLHASLLRTLAPPANGNDFARVAEHVSKAASKVVVIDDDPTGTQTVHGVDILSDWTVPSLCAALADPRPCFYILADTRSLHASDAAARVREIAANLAAAAAAVGCDFEAISRSDSTLRGHFSEELSALEEGLGRPIDGRIVIPAFFEGGRCTLDGIHYVAEGENLIPVAETEFARDRTFGFRSSRLPEWIEEKTGGAVAAADVACVGLSILRSADGADAVRRLLLGLAKGAYVAVDALAYPDLDVFAHGLIQAEEAGRRYLLRTAASFVRVRAGISTRDLLLPEEVSSRLPVGGLVVVGSYVAKTSAQLEALLELPGTAGIELRAGALALPVTREAEVGRVAAAALEAIRAGRHAVVYTSRTLESAAGVAGDLKAGRIVSDALVAVVRRIPQRPRFLIAKGGITSSGVAVDGLGMRRARVLGQAAPGVPVWEMGPETRYPGMRLVIWPGNVGGREALRDLVQLA